MNIGSIALTRVVRRQIKLKFNNFASARILVHSEIELEAGNGCHSEPSHISVADRRASDVAPFSGLISSIPPAVENLPRRESGGKPSRSYIRRISARGMGAQSEHARHLATLQKAERDLVIVSFCFL